MVKPNITNTHNNIDTTLYIMVKPNLTNTHIQ